MRWTACRQAGSSAWAPANRLRPAQGLVQARLRLGRRRLEQAQALAEGDVAPPRRGVSLREAPQADAAEEVAVVVQVRLQRGRGPRLGDVLGELLVEPAQLHVVPGQEEVQAGQAPPLGQVEQLRLHHPRIRLRRPGAGRRSRPGRGRWGAGAGAAAGAPDGAPSRSACAPRRSATSFSSSVTRSASSGRSRTRRSQWGEAGQLRQGRLAGRGEVPAGLPAGALSREERRAVARRVDFPERGGPATTRWWASARSIRSGLNVSSSRPRVSGRCVKPVKTC